MTRIFVYGTLKSTQSNYSELSLRNAVFIDKAITVDKWPLVVASSFNLPFLLNKKGYGKHIKGEIYEVDDKTIEFLDYFEGIDDNLYSKMKINVKDIKNNEIHEVSCYVLDDFKEEFLTEYDLWDDYDTHKCINQYDKEADTPDQTHNLLSQVKKRK